MRIYIRRKIQGSKRRKNVQDDGIDAIDHGIELCRNVKLSGKTTVDVNYASFRWLRLTIDICSRMEKNDHVQSVERHKV